MHEPVDLQGRLAERLVARHLKREDQHDAAPPSRIGPYSIERPVARAPYGRVYLAFDEEEERPVLVRVLARGRVRFTETLVEHVNALGAFEHPGFVRLLGGGVADSGEPFLVMEAADAPALADCALTLRERIDVVIEAARALNAAHERGIVHGDLNPTNIHVGERVRIRDLGVAALVVDESVRVYLGQLDYLAPEQLSGGEVGPWTDVHALGAIVYTLLAGRPPFEGGGVRSIVDRIRHAEVDPPSDFVSSVPPELERATLRALAKDPRARHPSALDLARELSRWRARQEIGRLGGYAAKRPTIG